MEIKTKIISCLLFLHSMVIVEANSISKDFQKRDEFSNNKPECWTDEIRLSIIKKYTKKYNMSVCSLGDSMPGGVVISTGVGFSIDQPTSKEKARHILLECAQDYIQEINNKKELRPYLRDYPVTAKNIDLSLSIHDRNGERIFYPNIGYASLSMGKLRYTTRDINDPDTIKTVERETYEEAVKRTKEDVL
jgi:hypothetical protein